ncbi:hypothetical protein LCGC14_1021520 [marine sediment metagenome]|uniref:Uncharacterized protein n=1 Tax=marine sediment metagenome TaxID=412755 RepID=A0A0F9QFE2_9ZZZZ
MIVPHCRQNLAVLPNFIPQNLHTRDEIFLFFTLISGAIGCCSLYTVVGSFVTCLFSFSSLIKEIV